MANDNSETLDDLVLDPGKDDVVFLDVLKEKELLSLLVRIAEKSKSIRTKHIIRSGYLVDLAKVLRRTYEMNIHRWGLDDGISREDLDFFEKRFEHALCPKKKWR